MRPIRTFRHHFKGGVTCEIRVNMDKVRDGRADCRSFIWNRRPKAHMFAEYRQWILTVWQSITDEIGRGTLEMLRIGDRQWEVWALKPGGEPERTGVLHGPDAEAATLLLEDKTVQALFGGPL